MQGMNVFYLVYSILFVSSNICERSDIDTKKELALKVIGAISIHEPQCRNILKELGAASVITLACVREEQNGLHNHLLSSSRKALICLTESKLNTLADATIALLEKCKTMQLRKAREEIQSLQIPILAQIRDITEYISERYHVFVSLCFII